MESSMGPKTLEFCPECGSHHTCTSKCRPATLLTVIADMPDSYHLCTACQKRWIPKSRIMSLEKIARLAFELGQSFERQEIFGESIIESMTIGKDEIDLHPSQYSKEWSWEWWELREVVRLLAKIKILPENELAKFLENTPEK